MPVFFCRWPNGDFSMVEATDQGDAVEALDEVGNADGVPLFEVEDFRLFMSFKLCDDGQFVLEHVGDHMTQLFWECMYPVLYDAQDSDDRTIHKAVIKERRRIKQQKVPIADTELGKDLQRAGDLPVSLANKVVEQAAKKALRKSKVKGKPQ